MSVSVRLPDTGQGRKGRGRALLTLLLVVLLVLVAAAVLYWALYL